MSQKGKSKEIESQLMTARTQECRDYENSLSFCMMRFPKIDYDVGLNILELYTFKEQILEHMNYIFHHISYY